MEKKWEDISQWLLIILAIGLVFIFEYQIHHQEAMIKSMTKGFIQGMALGALAGGGLPGACITATTLAIVNPMTTGLMGP